MIRRASGRCVQPTGRTRRDTRSRSVSPRPPRRAGWSAVARVNPSPVTIGPAPRRPRVRPLRVHGGKPQAEPSKSESSPVQVVIRTSLPPRAPLGASKQDFYSAPNCITSRLAGGDASAPPYLLCVLGLAPGVVAQVHEKSDTAAWRDEFFQTGRAPFDSKHCAVWRALFESFAPVERSLGPVYRLLLRSRGAGARGNPAPDSQAVYKLALDSASLTIDLGVTPLDLERVLHAYADDIPESTVTSLFGRNDLVGEDGQLQPLGVASGMVFAMVAPASYGARLTWFRSLDWPKASYTLQGFLPRASEGERSVERAPWT